MMSGEVFKATGLCKRFGRKRAVDGLDLCLEPGAVTVLLGPNGAGKSTLLRLALGVLRSNSGELQVVGFDPMRKPDEVRRRIGYVPDTPDAPRWMDIDELCRFSQAHYPTWQTELAGQLIERLDVPRQSKLGSMSRGQATKAMLVLALAHDPELLLLDEPFGGLDPLVREEVLAAVIGSLRAERRTVLCATHELEVAARIADRVAILHRGRIRRHGSIDELLGDEATQLPLGLQQVMAEVSQEALPC